MCATDTEVSVALLDNGVIADALELNGTEPDADACRHVLRVLGRVGEKWTVLVVGQLREGPMRYGELQRAVTGISQRMLTLTVRALERDGLVTRTVHPSIPPRVEYALTDRGRALLDPVLALAGWAIEYRDDVEASRRRYDDASRPDQRGGRAPESGALPPGEPAGRKGQPAAGWYRS
jgi:DNA-binding HxlR family transcriptional regulator